MPARNARTGRGPGRRRHALPAGSGSPVLTWWTDSEPAILRRRAGRGFRYLDTDGRHLDSPEAIARIRSLAIPPAWTDVRICPHPDGYLQATGRDGRGRKQYRYHPAWRQAREAAKFRALASFGEAAPRIRRRVDEDLRQPGLGRDKVLALVVALLEATLARVGNAEYARANGTFGLTTLRNRHLRASGSAVRLRFRAKTGKLHEVGFRDRRVARLVQRCRDLPGQHLFEFVAADGSVHPVRSEDVNEYLRRAAGTDAVSARMFRTWAATVLAWRSLRRWSPDAETSGADTSVASRRDAIAAAMAEVARHLGNTPAVAKASYVHPAVLHAFETGHLARQPAARARRSPTATDALRPWSRADELAVLELIRRHPA